ncbi:DNA recombination protein RmuC [Helicobacter anseris]|uniref:DNA recombination protein RmuC n=1 Tax=Helicobacter anseris TaxID=375926 RepID=A0A3D8J725_9HELI|nr:DNA recombination protein RmuC [Helicobacter anseris]RDU72995.1 DNA recombination protein RmuC [Helicobacter anseris]
MAFDFVFLIGILCFCTTLLLSFLLIKNNKTKDILQNQITEYKVITQTLKNQIQHFENEKQRLRQEYQEQNLLLEKNYQQNLEILEKKLQENYQTQNNLLLAQNKNMINEDSKKILDSIFAPLKEQIKDYSERLVKNEVKIETQIKSMFDFTQNIGDKANKLAQILKGDKKTRGNFGELQLKSILKNSGLIEGEQYKLQQHFKIEGSSYIPDAIIYLEKNKSIVVDAKFSLPNSFDFQEIDSQVCFEIYQNLKKRIDELAQKPYNVIQSDTYDFVLLFIPYQNILDLAIEANSDIYQYAYNKKVYLTTPHTLFMALKTISITWLNIKRNENITQAFDEIGKFHEKFVGVLKSFEDIKMHLQRLQKAKDDMENKLQTGQGNLTSRFQKIEELGVKTKKSLNC